MPMFVTDTELKARVASLMSVAPSGLAAKWDMIVRDSNRAAYNEIVGVLSGRGYTAAQIAAWVRGEEFEADIGLYWALVKGGGLEGYSDTFINKLDRREELAEVDVVVDGVVVDPDSEGDIGFGDFDTTGDLFVADSADARRGEVTQF